ncbi:MAG: hypothetical protein DA330_02315 [Nitrososphaera sp.]|nr:hypothetical protein [Nitrososphaera sp.]
MKFVLRGTVVTLDSRRRIIKDGCIGVDAGKIAFVKSARYRLPAEFQNAPVINVDGYIYPGLVDLHNHLAYNFLKLWKITKKFVDRYQWAGISRYGKEITAPMKLVTNANPVELMKYCEVKAMLGGATTIAGFAKFNKSYAAWLLRNVEAEQFEQESRIYTSVLKLRDEQQYLDTARKMTEGNAFIYHLAEGTSAKLHAEYDELSRYGLIRDKLVAIHCTALTAEHMKEMGRKKVKIVWSPLSNLLLYGATSDVVSAKKSRATICLGPDWSPTGSKSLLWELKVADLVNQSLNNAFTYRNLVEMVTVNPAKAIGWDDKVGTIQPGHLADLVVFDRIDDDPYRNLVLSTEGGLKLVLIGGRPRYGDLEMLAAFGIDSAEKITVDGREKAIDILEPGVAYGDIKLETVLSSLAGALANPIKAAKKLFETVSKKSAEPIRLIPLEEDEIPSLVKTRTFESFVEKNQIIGTKAATALDPLTMSEDKDFFKTLEENPNIPAYLAKLRQYAR